jgi:hypothetical protein
LLLLVLAALLVAGSLAAWRMTQKQNDTAVALYTPTAQEVAATACFNDYRWAVDQIAMNSDAGATTVMNTWGTADGRYLVAFNLYSEFSKYRSSYGRDAATTYVEGLIRTECGRDQVGTD